MTMESPSEEQITAWQDEIATLKARLAQVESSPMSRMQEQQNALIKLTLYSPDRPDQLAANLQELAEIISQALAVDRVTIWQLQEKSLQMRHLARVFPTGQTAKLYPASFNLQDFPTYYQHLKQAHLLRVTDVQTDERLAEFRPEFQMRGVQACIDAAIFLNGNMVGLLTLDDLHQVRQWTQEDIGFVKHSSEVIAKTMLHADLHQKNSALTTILEVSREVNSVTDLAETLLLIATKATKLSQTTQCAVLILNNEGIVTDVNGTQPYTNWVRRVNEKDSFGNGAASQALKQQEPVQIYDVWDQPDHYLHEQAKTRNSRATLAVPILSEGKVRGIISLVDDKPRHFSEAEINQLSILAQQCVNAVENARLLRRERDRRQQAEILRDVSATLAQSLDQETILDYAIDKISSLVEFDSASLRLFKKSQAVAVRSRGYHPADKVDDSQLPLSTRNIKFIKNTRQTLNIDDALTYSGWVRTEASAHIRSWLGVPLIAQGEVMGLFSLDHSQPAFFRPSHVEVVSLFAAQVSLALEKAQLFEQTNRRKQQLALLNQLGQEMTGAMDIQDLAHLVSHRLLNAFDYFSVGITLSHKKTREVELVGMAGAYATRLELGYRQSFDEGLIGRAAETGETFIVNDTSTEPDFFELKGGEVLSTAVLPLRADKKVLGVLTVDSARLNDFDQTVTDTLLTLADQLSVALKKILLLSETRERANQLEFLYAMSQNMIALRDLDTLLEQILLQMVPVFNGLGGAVLLHNEERNVLEWVIDIPEYRWAGQTVKQGEGLAGRIWHTGTALYVNDYGNWEGNIDIFTVDQPLAVLGVPIFWRDAFLGVLVIVANNNQRLFGIEDVKMLSQLASVIAIAINNARLYERLQDHAAELEDRVEERTQELQALLKLSQDLSQATQSSDIVRLLLLHLFQTIRYDVAAILLNTEASVALFIQSQYRLSPEVETQIYEIMVSTGEEVLALDPTRPISKQISQPDAVDDVDAGGAGGAGGAEERIIYNLSSMMQVPVLLGNKPFGLFLVATEEASQFGWEESHILRRAAEQAATSIQRLQSMLDAEHQRLDSLVAQLPDGIILLDNKQRILLINQAAQQFFGILSPVKVGDKLTQLGERTLHPLLKNFKKGTSFEITTHRVNQRPLIFEVTIKAIDFDGQRESWILVIRNVTESRTAQTQAQQQARLAAVGQLAAGIAHDFNNILTSIIGLTGLAHINSDVPAKVREDMGQVIEQSRHAAHLVRQILDFGRQSAVAAKALDLKPIVSESVALLERTMPETIHISFEAPDESYFVSADATLIQQTLANLALNARDAMPMGGLLTISLTHQVTKPGEMSDIPPGRWVVLSVIDTGEGIPLDIQAHIYEPFFTTKEVGKGTGLGLAQVYGIVKQHSGYIQLDSLPNQGTSFHIYLPQEKRNGDVPLPDIVISDVPLGRGELILLAEDDSDVQDITTTMLRHLKYQVLLASNGLEALQMYQQHASQLSLVLTDIMMPELSGLDLVRELRYKNPNLKIVALTGYALEDDEVREQLNAILEKPISIQQLGQTLHKVINQ